MNFLRSIIDLLPSRISWEWSSYYIPGWRRRPVARIWLPSLRDDECHTWRWNRGCHRPASSHPGARSSRSAIGTGLFWLLAATGAWANPAVDTRIADVLAGRLDAMIAAVEPEFPRYAQFKEMLARYRSLAARPAPPLPPLASPGSKIAVGDSYADVAALHAALVRLGDLEADSALPSDDRYSQEMAGTMRCFQARHGLLEDGILGRDTFAALNVPAPPAIASAAAAAVPAYAY